MRALHEVRVADVIHIKIPTYNRIHASGRFEFPYIVPEVQNESVDSLVNS